jgi:GT2 family glycosyltransferase
VAGDPRVSIVVITRDRRAELLENLKRLGALAERPEIHVLDNGSHDGTADAVERAFPQVRLTRLAQNLGAAARNLGVRQARTPYVAFADDDTWWESGSLAAGADLFDGCARLAVVTARILVEPGGREDPICAELAGSPLPGEPWLPGPELGSFLAGASIVRQEAFCAVGGFEPRLLIGGEEELLASDLMSAGWRLAYAEQLTVHHHASRLRDADLRRAQGIRNALWFWWLRRPACTAAQRTAALLADLPRDAVSARALVAAAAGAPWVIRRRRVVPPEVEQRYRLLDRTQMRSRARRYIS